MIIRKPMLCMAPDGQESGGGGSGGAAGAGAGAPGADGKAQADKSSQAGGGASQDDDLPKDPEELKKTLKAEREARAVLSRAHEEMKAKYQKRETEEEKARSEALKKQGQFEALYNEAAPKLATLEEKAKRQEAALALYYETELKGIPEAMRAIIPEGDTAARLEWISKAKAAGAFAAQGAPGKGKAPDGAPPPGGTGKVMNLAEFRNMTPKERAAYMAAGGAIAE